MNCLIVVPLHNFPELMLDCCKLIEEEWPRSKTARLLSLQTSSDKLPTCLILLDTEAMKVIGHCKLTPIPSIPDSCFVESMVISKALRGRRLGSYLMSGAEKHCRDKLKLRMVHISTKGQEVFYEKLGYEVCAPVSIYGGLQRRFLRPTNYTTEMNTIIMKCKSERNDGNETNNFIVPPPPPMPIIKMNRRNKTKQSRTYMVKQINI